MKYEIKIEFAETKKLEKIIKDSYFSNNSLGKLVGKKNFLKIPKTDPIYMALKGLNNMTIRITNESKIDGTMRFVISENESSVYLYPCSIYCIIEDGKYSFY